MNDGTEEPLPIIASLLSLQFYCGIFSLKEEENLDMSEHNQDLNAAFLLKLQLEPILTRSVLSATALYYGGLCKECKVCAV